MMRNVYSINLSDVLIQGGDALLTLGYWDKCEVFLLLRRYERRSELDTFFFLKLCNLSGTEISVLSHIIGIMLCAKVIVTVVTLY